MWAFFLTLGALADIWLLGELDQGIYIRNLKKHTTTICLIKQTCKTIQIWLKYTQTHTFNKCELNCRTLAYIPTWTSAATCFQTPVTNCRLKPNRFNFSAFLHLSTCIFLRTLLPTPSAAFISGKLDNALAHSCTEEQLHSHRHVALSSDLWL